MEKLFLICFNYFDQSKYFIDIKLYEIVTQRKNLLLDGFPFKPPIYQ